MTIRSIKLKDKYGSEECFALTYPAIDVPEISGYVHKFTKDEQAVYEYDFVTVVYGDDESEGEENA